MNTILHRAHSTISHGSRCSSTLRSFAPQSGHARVFTVVAWTVADMWRWRGFGRYYHAFRGRWTPQKVWHFDGVASICFQRVTKEFNRHLVTLGGARFVNLFPRFSSQQSAHRLFLLMRSRRFLFVSSFDWNSAARAVSRREVAARRQESLFVAAHSIPRMWSAGKRRRLRA